MLNSLLPGPLWTFLSALASWCNEYPHYLSRHVLRRSLGRHLGNSSSHISISNILKPLNSKWVWLTVHINTRTHIHTIKTSIIQQFQHPNCINIYQQPISYSDNTKYTIRFRSIASRLYYIMTLLLSSHGENPVSFHISLCYMITFYLNFIYLAYPPTYLPTYLTQPNP